MMITSAKLWLLVKKLHQSWNRLVFKLAMLFSKCNQSSICIKLREQGVSLLFIKTKWRVVVETSTLLAILSFNIFTKFMILRTKLSLLESTSTQKIKSKCTSQARDREMETKFRPMSNKLLKIKLDLTTRCDLDLHLMNKLDIYTQFI